MFRINAVIAALPVTMSGQDVHRFVDCRAGAGGVVPKLESIKPEEEREARDVEAAENSAVLEQRGVVSRHYSSGIIGIVQQLH